MNSWDLSIFNISINYLFIEKSILMIQKRKINKKLKLQITHIFGSSFHHCLRNSLAVLEDEGFRKVIYAAGKYIVIKTIEKPEMQLLPLSENLEKIKCMAFSPSKKHMAVNERLVDCDEIQMTGRQVPIVSIYNLKATSLKQFRSDKKMFSYT